MGCGASGVVGDFLGVKCFITCSRSGVRGAELEYFGPEPVAWLVLPALRAWPPTGPRYLLNVFTFLPWRSVRCRYRYCRPLMVFVTRYQPKRNSAELPRRPPCLVPLPLHHVLPI